MARRNPLSSWYAKSRIRRLRNEGIIVHGVRALPHGIWRFQTRCPDIAHKTRKVRKAILRQCRKFPNLKNGKVSIHIDDQSIMAVVATTLSGVIYNISIWPEMAM